MKRWFPHIRTGSGSDVYVERLSNALRNRGVEVVVSWFNHLHEIFPYFLKRVALPPGVNIVHANSWSAFAFKRVDVPLVVTMHHVVHDKEYAPYRNFAQAAYHGLLIRNYEARSIKQAEKVVAVSQYSADVASRLFQTGNITVIHNGIDTDRFSPGAATMFDHNKFNLLFVGSSSRRKGFDFLASVMRELGPEYQLYYTNSPGMFGPSPSKNSTYLGKLTEDQLVESYRGSDVFIFPSRYEGFGYVVAEAMACGKPVVTARTSSLPELIQDGNSGILCSPDSVGEFVRAIRRLRSDREFASNIAVQARKKIVENFSLDYMVDKYIELYRSIT